MQGAALGPVDVVVDGESRPVHGLRRTAVLAALADADWMEKQAARLDRLHAEVVHALAEARLAGGSTGR